MTGWVKRNGIALIVIVVLLPTLVFVLLGFPLLERASSADPVVAVKHASTVELAGYDFTLDLSREFPSGDADVPDGLALVAVVIEIEPGDDAKSDGACEIRLVEGERAWPQLGNPADYNYRIGEASKRYCVLDGEAMQLEVVFLVPDGVYEDAVVEISVTGTPGVYEFALR
jgi:hypothetical protein